MDLDRAHSREEQEEKRTSKLNRVQGWKTEQEKSVQGHKMEAKTEERGWNHRGKKSSRGDMNDKEEFTLSLIIWLLVTLEKYKSLVHNTQD